MNRDDQRRLIAQEAKVLLLTIDQWQETEALA